MRKQAAQTRTRDPNAPMSGPWLAAGLLLVVAVGVAPPITIAIAVGDAPLADRRGAFSALAALTAAGLVIGGFYELIDHVRRRGVPPVVRTGGGFEGLPGIPACQASSAAPGRLSQEWPVANRRRGADDRRCSTSRPGRWAGVNLSANLPLRRPPKVNVPADPERSDHSEEPHQEDQDGERADDVE